MNEKTVWITGASSGIGEALAKLYNQKGATVILSARRESALQTVKRACAFPEKIHILPLDLAAADTLEGKVKEALTLVPHIDILINNGGISQRSKVIETDMEVYRRLMEVNYFGAIALSKALIPHFVARKTGRFIVISSLMGKFASPLRSGYAASKHALHGFFDALRAEYHDKGLRVLLVCPGFIKTNISLNALKGDGSPQQKMDDAQNKGMTAEECAAAIFKGVERDKLEIVIGGKERFAVYIKRFFPTYLAKMMRTMKVT